jgi:hypothetical protein
MKRLDRASALRWCETRGIPRPHTRHDESEELQPGFEEFALATPTVGLRAIDFASWLLTLDDGGDALQAESVLIWLQDWDIWSVERERVGLRLLEALLGSRDFKALPAAEFSRNELSEAQSMLAVIALFQWDAILLPSHGEYLATFSHHGTVGLVARTPDVRLVIAEGVRSYAPHG